ncbi:MAG TPA: TetR/AcrR family transcriptional regulator [Sphingobium sp.]|nr:TetR/AcrR family transcriptional regulator [Sphingobium sp.]
MPPRPNASADEILFITVELIAEHDISGVTVDMVAEKAGVSKATIYRRWPSRSELIYDALASLARPGGNHPDTGSLRGDLTALLEELVEYLDRPQAGLVFASFLNAAVRDPQLSELRRQTTVRSRSAYEHVLRRAIDRGELDPNVDVAFLADIIVSPFLYRGMVDPTKTRPGDIQPVINLIIAGYGRNRSEKPNNSA